MLEQVVRKKIEKHRKEEIAIYAHADHDGICASVALNYLFGDIEPEFSKSFKPKALPEFKDKKLLNLCDLELDESQITNLLSQGMEIINFDHHEVNEVKHKNYLCLNPKKLFGKEFISSSGLIWKIFKPKEIAWVLASGSAGDLAVEDNLELFEYTKQRYPELLEGISLEAIYSSKIFELAQIILLSFDEPKKGFRILKENIDQPLKIYETELYREYLKKQATIQNFFEEHKDRVIEHPKFVLIDTSGCKYSGSYSVYLNLKFRDERVYIEYDKGRLFFRNYFGKEDIRRIARIFGGGGVHARSGGARTRKTFQEVYQVIKGYFENRQALLSEF